jgi:polysaccharide export outer membrane protein
MPYDPAIKRFVSEVSMFKTVREFQMHMPQSSRWLLTLPTLLTILMCLMVTACAPGATLPPLPQTVEEAYQLGVGDQIRIITFGQDQLTGEFRINDRGNVAIPLLGSIPANGLTTSELERGIEQRFKDKKILQEPSVSVEVMEYRPVFVLGEVAKPGQYPYQPRMTVLTAVAIAGGFTYRAQTDYASILRTEGGRSLEGRVQRGVTVRPGDVITVFQRYF